MISNGHSCSKIEFPDLESSSCMQTPKSISWIASSSFADSNLCLDMATVLARRRQRAREKKVAVAISSSRRRDPAAAAFSLERDKPSLLVFLGFLF